MARAKRRTEPAPERAEPDIRVEEDLTPVEPDLSGWTPHPSERRDIHNRIRAFPPSEGRHDTLMAESAPSRCAVSGCTTYFDSTAVKRCTFGLNWTNRTNPATVPPR
jgi:hypothetical protein